MRFDHDVTTTCGYCGVGCRLEAHAVDGRVVSISPALDGPANHGHTCLKGRFAHGFSRKRDRLRTPLIRDARGGELRAGDLGRGDRPHRGRADADPRRRRRPRRDRRPRLLARDERGLLRHAAPHARRDRHAQHRQLLARLPLPHLVGAAPVARPVRRDRLVRRHRRRGRGDHHRRQPDRGPSGRRARGSSRRRCAACSSSRSTRAASSCRTTPCCTSARARDRTPRSCSASPTSSRATGWSTAPSSTRAPRAGTRSRTCSPTTRPADVQRISGIPAADLERAAHIYAEAGEAIDPLGPRRHRAQVRLGGRAAHLQPRAHVRQGRPARLGAAAAARAEQRPGLVGHGRAARHVHRLPVGRSTRTSRGASRRAGA